MKPLLIAFLFCSLSSCLASDDVRVVAPKQLGQSNPPPISPKQGETFAFFHLPNDWSYVDTTSLPPSVKIMAIKRCSKSYPPSINLGLEPYQGTLNDYLKIVHEINKAQHCQWRDLGFLETNSGKCSLSSVDMPSAFGLLRLTHLITISDGYAFIVTASTSVDDFQEYKKEILTLLRSFTILRTANGLFDEGKMED